MMRNEKEIIGLIIKIAKEDDRIRAVYMHGSRANPNDETDKYSDYDIVFVVTEINSFLNDKDWINKFGDIIFTFEGYRNQNDFFKKEINDLSRRYVWCMLFNDGSHIDLMAEIREEAVNHTYIKNKPIIILLDKDGCLPKSQPLSDETSNVKKPSKDEYTACCSGFWWFLNTVAKGIARDQLSYAKDEFNSKILMTLNCMIDWYIGVQTNFSVPSGKSSKYYKKYLPSKTYNLYTNIYSDSDYMNFWNAIFSTCELFSIIASDVGDYFNFIYNKQEEDSMIDYLVKVRDGRI